MRKMKEFLKKIKDCKGWTGDRNKIYQDSKHYYDENHSSFENKEKGLLIKNEIEDIFKNEIESKRALAERKIEELLKKTKSKREDFRFVCKFSKRSGELKTIKLYRKSKLIAERTDQIIQEFKAMPSGIEYFKTLFLKEYIEVKYFNKTGGYAFY